MGAALSSGVTTSATLGSSASTLGIQNKAGVAIVNRVDANGTETPTKAEVFSFAGTSGSTITTLGRGLAGSSDADHAIGAVVEFGPDVVWAQGLIDTFVTEHGTDGTHDATLIAELAGAQTFTGAKTFTTGLLKAVDITSGSGVNTLPTSTDTLVGRATTDTLTNKTLTTPTLTNPVINYTDTGLGTNVRARAYRNTAQAITNQTAVKVELGTESYDPGSDFDHLTNFRYTAPVTGYYLVSGMVEYDANATGARYCNIYVNGAMVSGQANMAVTTSLHATRVSHTDIIYLTATNYVELIAYQISGGSLNTSTTNKPYLTVHLLSV